MYHIGASIQLKYMIVDIIITSNVCLFNVQKSHQVALFVKISQTKKNSKDMTDIKRCIVITILISCVSCLAYFITMWYSKYQYFGLVG